MGKFAAENSAGWSNNTSSDLRGRKKSWRPVERYFPQKWPQSQTEVNLELISSKNTFPNRLIDLLGMEKSEL